MEEIINPLFDGSRYRNIGLPYNANIVDIDNDKKYGLAFYAPSLGGWQYTIGRFDALYAQVSILKLAENWLINDKIMIENIIYFEIENNVPIQIINKARIDVEMMEACGFQILENETNMILNRLTSIINENCPKMEFNITHESASDEEI